MPVMKKRRVRRRLLATRLINGQTLQEWFESWGLCFDGEGWVACQPAEKPAATRGGK